MGGFATILDVLFLEETYQKTLLKKRAQFFRTETRNWAIHHISEEEVIDFKDLVHKHLALPLKLLFLEPIVFLITLYTAVCTTQRSSTLATQDLTFSLVHIRYSILVPRSIPYRLCRVSRNFFIGLYPHVHWLNHWGVGRMRHRHRLRTAL